MFLISNVILNQLSCLTRIVNNGRGRGRGVVMTWRFRNNTVMNVQVTLRIGSVGNELQRSLFIGIILSCNVRVVTAWSVLLSPDARHSMRIQQTKYNARWVALHVWTIELAPSYVLIRVTDTAFCCCWFFLLFCKRSAPGQKNTGLDTLWPKGSPWLRG